MVPGHRSLSTGSSPLNTVALRKTSPNGARVEAIKGGPPFSAEASRLSIVELEMKPVKLTDMLTPSKPQTSWVTATWVGEHEVRCQRSC